MTFEQWMAIISAVTTPLVAIAVAYSGRQIVKVSAKVDEVHFQTNSIKDELVASTAKASLAEGHAAGLAEGQAAGIRLEERKP